MAYRSLGKLTIPQLIEAMRTCPPGERFGFDLSPDDSERFQRAMAEGKPAESKAVEIPADSPVCRQVD